MTLVELLVTVSILGIISFALTQAIILGLRTTQGTGARVSNSSAAQAMASFFTSDVASADEIFEDEGASPACAGAGEVILHVRWTDRSVVIPAAPPGATEVVTVERSVSYTLEDAPIPTEQQLVRWECAAGSPAAPRVIGHFSRDSEDAPAVSIECLPEPPVPGCPAFAPGSTPVPSEVRLSTDPSNGAGDLTVRRRAA